MKGRMDDFLKKRVYEPVGMKDTCYVLTEEQKQRCAPTLIKKDGGLLVAEVHDPIANYHSVADHCPGNAGLFSTAPDLARYCSMVLESGKTDGHQVLKRETVSLMTSPQSPAGVGDKRALGWDIYSSRPYCTELNETTETLVIGHTGYTGTWIWLDKKSKTFIVLLTNRTFPDDSKVSGQITGVRRQVADTVLRALPEYQAYFAEQAQSGGRGHARN
jgi:serine-type D-Ala-D-Ala carboxypeptidase